MITGKIIALTRETFVGEVMSLLLNMLSRWVIAFFQEQTSFNFMAAVTISGDSGAQKKKKKSLSQFQLFPHLFALS